MALYIGKKRQGIEVDYGNTPYEISFTEEQEGLISAFEENPEFR